MRNTTALADLNETNNIAAIFAVVIILAAISRSPRRSATLRTTETRYRLYFFGVFMLLNRFL